MILKHQTDVVETDQSFQCTDNFKALSPAYLPHLIFTPLLTHTALPTWVFWLFLQHTVLFLPQLITMLFLLWRTVFHLIFVGMAPSF